MRYLSKKIQSVAIVLLFLGGAIAVLMFVSHAVTTKGADLAERVRLVADEQAFEKQFSQLAATVHETESERALLAAAVLKDDRDTIELLSSLDAIAAQQGVTLTTTNLSEVERAGQFNTLALTYTISGSEEGVIRMLELLQTIPYHGDITSVSVRRNNEKENGLSETTAQVALALSIKRYD